MYGNSRSQAFETQTQVYFEEIKIVSEQIISS